MQQHRDLLKRLSCQEKKRRTEIKRIDTAATETAFDFAAEVGTVRLLPVQNRIERIKDNTPIRIRPKENPVEESEGFYIGTVPDCGEIPSSFTKNGRGKGDLDRLRSSYWPIAARLDLHGCRQEEAQVLLNRFISEVRAQQGVCVEIVHGSGLGSRDFVPVLKTLVRRWLAAHPDVLAYTEPHRNNDGSVLVLLKKLRK